MSDPLLKYILSFCLCFLAVANSDYSTFSDVHSFDAITIKDGTVLHHSSVRYYTDRQVYIKHADGEAWFYRTDLPEDILSELGLSTPVKPVPPAPAVAPVPQPVIPGMYTFINDGQSVSGEIIKAGYETHGLKIYIRTVSGKVVSGYYLFFSAESRKYVDKWMIENPSLITQREIGAKSAEQVQADIAPVVPVPQVTLPVEKPQETVTGEYEDIDIQLMLKTAKRELLKVKITILVSTIMYCFVAALLTITLCLLSHTPIGGIMANKTVLMLAISISGFTSIFLSLMFTPKWSDDRKIWEIILNASMYIGSAAYIYWYAMIIAIILGILSAIIMHFWSGGQIVLKYIGKRRTKFNVAKLWTALQYSLGLLMILALLFPKTISYNLSSRSERGSGLFFDVDTYTYREFLLTTNDPVDLGNTILTVLILGSLFVLCIIKKRKQQISSTQEAFSQ